MNTTLPIAAVAVFPHDSEAGIIAGLEAVRETLPRAAARRMSRIGLALHALCAEAGHKAATPLIFASAFGMTLTLEDYLASFPHPSPLAFQNSIHPAGVEQVLVNGRSPVREFVPVAGEESLLVVSALETLFRTPGKTRRLLGAEERATWMSEAGCGAGSTFAYRLDFDEAAGEPAGLLRRVAAPGPEFSLPTHAEFADALARRLPLRIGTPDTAGFILEWK